MSDDKKPSAVDLIDAAGERRTPKPGSRVAGGYRTLTIVEGDERARCGAVYSEGPGTSLCVCAFVAGHAGPHHWITTARHPPSTVAVSTAVVGVDLATEVMKERDEARLALAAIGSIVGALRCPACNKLHTDRGREGAEEEWVNRPHRTHRCVDDGAGKGCGHEWRPPFSDIVEAVKVIADYPTMQVERRRTEELVDAARAYALGMARFAGHEIPDHAGLGLVLRLLGETKGDTWRLVSRRRVPRVVDDEERVPVELAAQPHECDEVRRLTQDVLAPVQLECEHLRAQLRKAHELVSRIASTCHGIANEMADASIAIAPLVRGGR